MTAKIKKPRAHVSFNTGTRVHKPKKGKGSYDRKEFAPTGVKGGDSPK